MEIVSMESMHTFFNACHVEKSLQDKWKDKLKKKKITNHDRRACQQILSMPFKRVIVRV